MQMEENNNNNTEKVLFQKFNSLETLLLGQPGRGPLQLTPLGFIIAPVHLRCSDDATVSTSKISRATRALGRRVWWKIDRQKAV